MNHEYRRDQAAISMELVMKREIERTQFIFNAVSALIVFATMFSSTGWAQQSANAVVPTLVRFGGLLTDVSGMPMSGTVGVTFSLYTDQRGGAPLWLETQNVVPDRNGRYSVQLGSTKPDGLPTGLFTSGEARWLGVRPEGLAEQPRVLLLSVPYALKAGDAETLGGLPASAFVLAAPASATLNTTPEASAPSASTAAPSSPPPATNVTGAGTLNFIPLWTSTSNIANSVLFQSGSGVTAKIGVNTTSPAATLDVKGTANIQGLFSLPATGVATATGGRISQAQDFVASSFNSGTAAAVSQTFQWRAEPTGNNTATPAGTLNLLFGSGATAPTETGLKLGSTGLFTFAAGQKFPGTGTITGVSTAAGGGLSGGGTTGALSLSLLKTCAANQTLQWSGSAWVCATISGSGTITGVTAGTDLTGGGTSGKVTLNLDTTKVPQLSGNNSFTGNQTVNGAITAISFSGSGAAVTNVNASQLGGVGASGFAQLAANNTFSGTQTVNSNVSVTSPISFGAAINATNTGTGNGIQAFAGNASGFALYGGNSSSGNGVGGVSSTGVGVYAQNNSFSQGALYAENDGFGPAGYFKGGIQTTGKITTYNNIATTANGVPSIVAQVAFFSNGSGDGSYQNLYTPTNDGIFRIIAFQECLATSGGASIFSIDFLWTLPSGGQGFGQDFGGSCGSLSFNSASVLAHAKGGTPLQFNYSGMDAPFQTTILVEQLL
jgi:hypothetical protein